MLLVKSGKLIPEKDRERLNLQELIRDTTRVCVALLDVTSTSSDSTYPHNSKEYEEEIHNYHLLVFFCKNVQQHPSKNGRLAA